MNATRLAFRDQHIWGRGFSHQPCDDFVRIFRRVVQDDPADKSVPSFGVVMKAQASAASIISSCMAESVAHNRR